MINYLEKRVVNNGESVEPLERVILELSRIILNAGWVIGMAEFEKIVRIGRQETGS